MDEPGGNGHTSKIPSTTERRFDSDAIHHS
jgi:hypothetical protein